MKRKNISILGIRGIPANHGGFETFAEKLALYLVKNGWHVTVFCQEDSGNKVEETYWKNILLVKIPINIKGSLGTIIFDFKAAVLANKYKNNIALTLGYNTAIFNLLIKLKGIKNIINMDGLEWKRRKYNFIQKLWLYLNEKAAVQIADHLIADNPGIENHLKLISPANKKITMIPYGSDITKLNLDKEKVILKKLNINEPYILIVARPVEENNIYEVVKAFSNKKRDHRLVIFGRYSSNVLYQKKVLKVASEEVMFLGAIYDSLILAAVRKNAKLYIHGHSVGGTNPALVEAMSCGIPVLAHNNTFNKWVAGEKAEYFNNELDIEEKIEEIINNNNKLINMSNHSKSRFNKFFKWEQILKDYEEVFLTIN